MKSSTKKAAATGLKYQDILILEVPPRALMSGHGKTLMVSTSPAIPSKIETVFSS
jgi:hypothetical protein